jgi:hypothetical protein
MLPTVVIGLQAIFMTCHKQQSSFSRMLKDFAVLKFPIIHEYAALSLTFATWILFRLSGSELFNTFTNIILLGIFPL